MKQLLLLPTLLLLFISGISAQNRPGPVEQKVTDNICDCISKVDLEKINGKKDAEQAFVDCFTQQSSLIVDLAKERNADFTDQAAMRTIGTDIGKNLLTQNCQAFLKLSVAMVEKENIHTSSGTTEGRLKRIETKDFNYFVVTDSENKERSFIWLRQFPGSESFMNDTSKLAGKKLKIKWNEIEVYIPSAKNYYNIKEIVALEVL